MSSHRIMVVEDEELLRLGTTLHLKSFGYEVAGNFKSGEEAIDHVAKLKPDVILMDIELAGDMNGIETAAKIHEKWDVPVIYLSVYADINTINLAESTKPFRYMNKPFNEDELKFTIEMAIESHKTSKELKEAMKYKNILENIPGIVYRINYTEKEDFEIILFNEMLKEMTGYELDELKSQESLLLATLIVEEDKEEILKQNKILINSKEAFNLKYQIVNKQAEIKSICESCKPVFDDKGNLKRIDGIINEI